MEQVIMRGKPVADALRAQFEAKIAAAAARGQQVTLATFRVEGDAASEVYQKRLAKTVASVGAHVQQVVLPETVSQTSAERTLQSLIVDHTVTAILPLQPFPRALDADKLLAMIPAAQDADCLTPAGAGEFYLGHSPWGPATARSCMAILDFYGVELPGKHAVVLGRSNVIGKPVAHLLQQANATVTLCHSRTRDLADICRRADVVVAAIGKAGFVTPDMLREGAVLVDVGINVLPDGGICGDATPAAYEKCSAYTPVPGGVGVVSNWMIVDYLTRNLPEA